MHYNRNLSALASECTFCKFYHNLIENPNPLAPECNEIEEQMFRIHLAKEHGMGV